MPQFKDHLSAECRDVLQTARSKARELPKPWQWSLIQCAAMLQAGDISSTELTESVLMRIDQANGGAPTFDGSPDAINAWTHIYPELAMEQAAAADRVRAAGGTPLLSGVPIGLKDVIAVAGLPLTASSRVLEGNVPEADSAIWAELKKHGVVLVGHQQLHEFANGSTADQVGNPYDLTRSAGGSSAGSAAAVATGMSPAALGTDTGGSLRVPAALCGVAAVKPTYGSVPLEGVIPMAPSRDTAGPIGRTVQDCSALLQALFCGRSKVDPMSAFSPGARHLPLSARGATAPLAGVRVALTDRPERVSLDPDVLAAYEAVQQAVSSLGAELVHVAAPAPRLTPSDLDALLYPEAWLYHRQHFPHRSHLYRPSVRATVEKASLSYDLGDYIACRERRDQELYDWDSWMQEHRIDIILEPTVHYVAKPRGSGYEVSSGTGSLAAASLPRQWNILGYPVVSMPAGLGQQSRLPVGVSLIARRLQEQQLIQAALTLETALESTWPRGPFGPSDRRTR